MKQLSLLFLLALLPLASQASITTSTSLSNPLSVTGVADPQGRPDLFGTYVTFNFLGAPSLSTTFDAAGLAAVGGVSLSMNAAGIPNTNAGEWTLSNSTPLLLTSVYIVGVGPNSANQVVFDKAVTPLPGTPQSDPEFRDAVCAPSSAICNGFTIFAVYTRPVSVGLQPFQNDLYGELDLVIINNALSAANGGTITFLQDTDQVVTPEPGSMALIGFGLLGVAAIKRRR